MLQTINPKPVILFDGVCNLCNRSVQYVIRHDPAAIFQFASLQGETGQTLLAAHKLATNDLNSFVLIQNDKAYTKSTAALLVARQLKGPAKLLYACMIIPAFIRDIVYRIIARNRYTWFGKKNSCMIPDPKVTSRFLKD